jgi:hypothetical protein
MPQSREKFGDRFGEIEGHKPAKRAGQPNALFFALLETLFLHVSKRFSGLSLTAA